ncbi:SMP-30/gluconolactonase/LRE family protein [Burkholderia sp. Bp8963]|uniref:SMP-30/gluconolactonase/LRE family protein n=1 Tax=Burkholderia sp. Bp8963 TaxID=2184547 RepID=UPI0021AB8E84|nr:SMP-30/gluconolactonase/LRE family protein [Burkholderia sp. Bp8963]
MNKTKSMLMLPMLIWLVLLATPLTTQAWERGTVERFATVPPGEAHPAGITVDREGNIYVTTFGGTFLVFDPQGKYLRTVGIGGTSGILTDIGFHPQTGKLLVVDNVTGKVLSVDPRTGASSVFMTVTGKDPGLDGLMFDAAGNVYVTDGHQGIIWKVGPYGGEGSAWVTSPLLKPTRLPPGIGANDMAFNNEKTALFVSNTANDTIVKIPVTGPMLEPGTPEIFVNRVGGGPDGLKIDGHDNIWVVCNQSDEILVLEPTQGRVIAKLGDFGGIDRDGAPIGFLWPSAFVFHGEDVLVTNISLDYGAAVSQDQRTIDGPWARQVKVHTISRIRIPEQFGGR